MSYQDDPDLNPRRNLMRSDIGTTGWIIGAIVAVVVIIGIIVAFSNNSGTNNTASNGTTNAPATSAKPPATTGAGNQAPAK